MRPVAESSAARAALVPACTSRLSFRPWCPDDGELAFSLWADPAVARFIYAVLPDRAATDERLAGEMAHQRSHGVSYWPIFLRSAGGEHVGCAGLRVRGERDLELGVHLRARFFRQGLASEAARAVIDHAFGVMGASSLYAGHHPENAASRAMLARLGFRRVGEDFFPPTGLVHPAYALGRG